MEYEEAIEYLYDLKIYGMSLGLERIEYLLKVLDSPHKDLKVIHVAGTNGKGSVCAMLSSILQSAGYKVGLFTSPHLISFEERIRVDGVLIPKDRICAMVERIKPIADTMAKSGKFDHPTFFEIVTAMAFEHFFQEDVDFAILEVGLGGRLDATNVIRPVVSVITTVDLDHIHVLGKSLEEVAGEKAGIIKNGVPVISGIENDDLLTMIKQKCKEKGSDIYASKECGTYIKKQGNLDAQIFDIELNDKRYQDLKIHLLGDHQLKNALTAALTVDVMDRIGIRIPVKSQREGFENTRWPARFEVIKKDPMVVLDCAHNPAGMRALNSTLMKIFKDMKLTLVIGIMRDKDIPGIVKEIANSAENIIVTRPKFERAAEPEIIESEVKKYCNNVLIKSNVADAVGYAIERASQKDIICITGSIFNVGEAMVALGRIEQ
ncbi:MAG: bifunctional folylpolyglutamate synthase/dihydrofolate synthase [Thermoplasmata archaeon]|nr:MAG: bifunctional folylpolyglutamate synthase/dihydrofolate synthase [Thermoplasmata archaeon]